MKPLTITGTLRKLNKIQEKLDVITTIEVTDVFTIKSVGPIYSTTEVKEYTDELVPFLLNRINAYKEVA